VRLFGSSWGGGPLHRPSVKVRATKGKVEVGAGLLTTGASQPGHWLARSRPRDHVELRMAMPGFQELDVDDVCRRSPVTFSSWLASGSTRRRFPPRRLCRHDDAIHLRSDSE
jgi:hypothetical protein